MHRWELALLLIELGLLSGVGTSEQEAATRQWLERMDEDANGTIEWAELLAWWKAPGGGKACVNAIRLVTKLRSRVSSRRAAAATATATGAPAAAATPAAGATAGASLPEADRHALKSLFTRHDADLSGYIDQGELLPLLKDLGVVGCGDEDEGDADELLAEMEMADMDANGDDKVSFDELCDWWARTGRGAPPKRPDVAAARALTNSLLAQRLDG